MAWTAFRWVWRITTNVFYLMVVWYFRSQLRGHTENIIIPILGIIYVAIRFIGYGLALLIPNFTIIVDEMDNKLAKLADPAYERDNEALAELKKKWETNQWLSYLDMGGLWVISLLCLWHLFITI